MDPFHPAAELVAGLEKTWQMIEKTLARLTPADLEQVFPPLDEAERVRHAKLVEPALQPFAQMWLDAAALFWRSETRSFAPVDHLGCART